MEKLMVCERSVGELRADSSSGFLLLSHTIHGLILYFYFFFVAEVVIENHNLLLFNWIQDCMTFCIKIQKLPYVFIINILINLFYYIILLL